MIKIEKTLLFIIVLVLLVGAVSATETLREDQTNAIDEAVASDISIVSQDNEKIIKFEEKKVLDENPQKKIEYTTHNIEKRSDNNLKKEGIVEVHNYTELKNAVNNASSIGVDTTIRLLQGSYNNTGTITWYTGGMVLTIDGNGQTINGQQQQVFIIRSGSSLVLKNIIITNATSSDGGAIRNLQGTLTVSNSTFNNNQATNEGGAIRNYQGTLTVSNSTFNNNQAGTGGAIRNYQGTLTVSNSTFNNNQATSAGGAIRNYQGTLTVSNSTFNNNQATSTSAGGAIHNIQGTLTVSNSTFNNNQATSDGGAICDDSMNKLTNIISSNFINNTALNGAAINALGWINLTNNTFKQNTATNNTETIDLYGYWNGLFEGNTYESTDIALNEISLNLKDDQSIYTTDEDVILNFTIQPTNTNYYYDYETGINDITLYINGQKNITTKYENYTLSGLEPGEYEVYYTTCNQQSNTVTFKVIGDAEVNVTNYTQLVQAIANATREKYNSYKINLQPGDYNATTSINWENSATKKIIINGNNNTLNGQNTHQFIKITEGHNLTLENITITNYTSSYGGAISNNYGTLTVSNSTFNNNQATMDGGAIYNNHGTLTVSNSTFNNNQASTGGAICNYYGTLTVSNSTFNNNQAVAGGAIFDYSQDELTNIISSNFINNTASNGAAIRAYGGVNLTNNTFKENTATFNQETIDLVGYWNGLFEGNVYESTDISLDDITLIVNNNHPTQEGVELNYTIQPANFMYYWDFEDGINDITLYIDGEKNITTRYENTTLKGLTAGTHEIYFTSCNRQSNTVTVTVKYDTNITTPQDIYEYYSGANTKIPLNITDSSGEKGKIELDVYESGVGYKLLAVFDNVNDGYTLSTETIAQLLENYYGNLDSSYVIGLYYVSYNQYSNPKLTHITLNINKQRNTTIVYDILNNTEGNVQINITVQDAVYKTPIADASIQITGDINTDTTSGILTDNTLTPGDYTINVEYPETEDYKASQTTIDFTVEIDKDVKIADLEGQVENLTEKLDQANEKIENLTNQLDQAKEEIETLNNTISNLTTQLEEAENKISTLNNSIENLTQQLEQAQEEIETLNNTNNNLTRQLEEANQKIETLNNQISNLTQKIKEKDNQIENLTEEITDLTKQLQDAQKEIQALTQENNNLNNQLEQAKEEIETLNNTIKELTRPPLNTTITITPIKSSVGSIVNLSANVKDQNGEKVSGGKVIFKVNGITLKDEYNNVLYATLTDGLATLKYKVQAAWMKNTSYIEAVYGGNENCTSSRSKSSNILNITEGIAKVSLDKSSFTVKSGETITLRAKIVDANGDNINRGKVVFKLNGKTLTDKNGKTLQANVAGGEAVLEYTIPSTYSSRTYNLTAVYGGEGYTRSQTTGKLTINKKGVTINTDSITTKNNKTTLKATITDETGELLVRNTNLAIKVNGITILNGVNSTNGKIDLSFTTTFRPGMYELQIISGENGIYKTGKMTTVLKI